MAKMYGKGKTAESEEQQKIRWQVELEFVQCLANPNYLNFLAQRGYFKDQPFINYLKYLQYWKEPDYAKYLMYPMCLYFLDLLQYEHFRREIVNSQCCKFIDEQAILQWQHYTRKRIKMFNAVSDSTQQQQQQQQQQQNNNTGATTAGNNAGSTTAATGTMNVGQEQNAPIGANLPNGISSGAAAISTQQQQQQIQTHSQQQQQQQQVQQQQQQMNGMSSAIGSNSAATAGVGTAVVSSMLL